MKAALWNLDLRHTGADPKYKILADHVARAIARGALGEGDRIPSVADLARRLKVNKATVVQAFRDLERKKLISSQVGRGSFVAAGNGHGASGASPADLPPGDTHARPEVRRLIRRLRDTHVAGVTELLALASQKKALNLWAGVPPETSVSPRLLAGLAGGVFKKEPERLFRYAHHGLGELREALARWLGGRGYRLEPEQILITNGSQQALALAALWAREHERVMLCETPTYIGIPRLFSQTGLQVEPVAWEKGALEAERLHHHARSRASIVYCCPEFHNPTGQCMSSEGRADLVQLATEHDAVVIVDDIFRDLRFEGAEKDSLFQALPPARRILAGSVSKSFLPGLRVGFLAADRPLIEELMALKRWMDLGGPPLVQAIVARLLDDGHYASHLARMRPYYRERRDAITAALDKLMPRGVSHTRPEGGFQLWVRMPPPSSSVAVYLQALERGVAIGPGPAHDIDGRYLNCFRLGYGWAGMEDLKRAAGVVAEVVKTHLKSGTREVSATGIL